jgi:SPP1 gp7 family putative phage head morphogenesis protein
MADNQKPPTRKKTDKERQQRVLDRMQRDLDGYVEQYDAILDRRQQLFAQEIRPYWQQATFRILQELRKLISETVDAQRVPITQDPIDPAKYRNMQREIERLTILAQQIVALAQAAMPEKMRRNLAYTYTDSYYFHAWGLEQATRLAINVPTINAAGVMGILANPWLPDGNTYSDRIRANTAYLAEKMRAGITDAVNMGWDWNKTARHIQDIADEGYHNSVRLARTEINRAASQSSTHILMQNADILDGKRWNATLDARTAPKDAANDHKVYDLAYDTVEMPGRPGERIPNHPNCRCKYSPVVSGVSPKIRERIARDAGDTSSSFGERTYTKVADYREYAKQRGIDLDERLRNDDPRRYLNNQERRGLPQPTF